MNWPTISKAVLTLGLLFGVGFTQMANLRRIRADIEDVPLSELRRQNEVANLRLGLLSQLPNFGFKNLVSSWTFLNFLQYFGDSSARSINGYGLSPTFFEIIVNRDPYFVDSYVYLFTL